MGVSSQKECGVHRWQCQAGGLKHLLSQGIQPLEFLVRWSGRECARICSGNRGLDHQAFQGRVLGEEVGVTWGGVQQWEIVLFTGASVQGLDQA